MMKYFFTAVWVSFAFVGLSQGNVQQVNSCIIEKGVLKKVVTQYDNSTGEHSVIIDGIKKDFRTYSNNNPDYAVSADWYINSETISISGKLYSKYGLPRVIGVNEVVKITAYKGVGVYAEAGQQELGEVIYIPVRADCEFQPYAKTIPPCGNIKVQILPASPKKGEVVNLTCVVENPKETYTYNWTADFFGAKQKITFNQAKATLSPDPAISEATVIVTVKGKNCRSDEYISVTFK